MALLIAVDAVVDELNKYNGLPSGSPLLFNELTRI